MNTGASRIVLRGISSGRHPAFHAIAVAMFAALASVSVSATGLSVEQRIQRIQSGLLPPVLVKGESTQLIGLSTRMDALHVPGVSIAVIHDGKLEWARGFGVTRVGGPPVTPETLFQAASISKVVSTLVVLKLAQTRKLDLDTDVNQYLKTWKLPTSELTRQAKVTLRGLLTHSAGTSVHGFAGFVRSRTSMVGRTSRHPSEHLTRETPSRSTNTLAHTDSQPEISPLSGAMAAT